MRRWWKTMGVLAGGVLSIGGWLSSASAQFPPPGGGMGMPPGGMGMMPPGGGMGMPSGGMGMMPPPGTFGGNPPPGMPAEFPNAAQPSGEPAAPFSIKDEGMPNAFTSLVDPRSLRPLRWQFDEGYTMLWFRAGNYPTLATTGKVTDRIAGALGQPGTKILSRPPEPGLSSAFRTTVTYWLKDPEVLSLEGNFFIMEQRSILQDFNSNQNGDPVLARPFFNAVTRREDADPRALPGILRGTLHDSVTTRLMGAEANLRWNSSNRFQGSSLNFLGGVRWIQLNERYSSFDTSVDISGIGTSTSISDTFTTYNQFYGGQIGLDWQYKLDRLTLGLTGKVAVGPNYQTIKVSGETVTTNLATAVAVTAAQGLFAQPTNIGVYRAIQTSVIPEFGTKMSVDLTDRLRFNIGYTFLLMTNIARPGDQIDRTINIQPLLIGTPNAPLLPGPPTFRQSTFHAHMLNLGIEFLF